MSSSDVEQGPPATLIICNQRFGMFDPRAVDEIEKVAADALIERLGQVALANAHPPRQRVKRQIGLQIGFVLRHKRLRPGRKRL